MSISEPPASPPVFYLRGLLCSHCGYLIPAIGDDRLLVARSLGWTLTPEGDLCSWCTDLPLVEVPR